MASLPNLWHIYNLRESPFFQDTLQASEDARYPMELFIGRTSEARRILTQIGSSASSRQTVEGRPGVGKTTLVQYVKTEVAAAKVLSHAEPVRIEALDTTEVFLVKMLSYVYETLLGAGGKKIEKLDAMKTAKQIVRTFRVIDASVQAGFQIPQLGINLSGGRSSQLSNASTASPSLTVSPLLRELWRLASQKLDARGILVHVNNFENLDDAAQTQAGVVLRDVRDMMLFEGYHYILVGTTQAIRSAITPHPQLRSVFSISDELESLAVNDVHRILQARYKFLHDDAERGAPIPPVEGATVHELYTMFRGDLRGFLLALDTAANALIGYAERLGAPMALDDIKSVLRTRYSADMHKALSGKRHLVGYLLRLEGAGNREITQQELQQLWGIGKSAVSNNAAELQEAGYLREARRDGRMVFYELSGTAQLVLG